MTGPKQRRARFDRLLRLRQQALLQTEQQLAQLMQERQAARAKLDRMGQRLDQLSTAPFSFARTDPTSAWETMSRYTDQLRTEIQQQHAAMTELHARWLVVRQRYAHLRAKAKSIELLLEKHAEEVRTSTLRNEQRQLDDMMLSRRHAEQV